jgi:hypothetical protein
MTPQTTTEWRDEIYALAQLKRTFEKTWTNTVFAFEVGDRAALPAPADGGTPE